MDATFNGTRKKCKACNSYTDKKFDFLAAVDRVTKDPHKECPLDREQLGRKTWGFLHTMAAYWTEKPAHREQEEMKNFIIQFSKYYPCEDCAYALRIWMKSHPPVTSSQKALSRWFCEAHNEVNARLGKKLFNCDTVEKRWKDGWDDGTCD